MTGMWVGHPARSGSSNGDMKVKLIKISKTGGNRFASYSLEDRHVGGAPGTAWHQQRKRMGNDDDNMCCRCSQSTSIAPSPLAKAGF